MLPWQQLNQNNEEGCFLYGPFRYDISGKCLGFAVSESQRGDAIAEAGRISGVQSKGNVRY
jgi:hypothetical protein